MATQRLSHKLIEEETEMKPLLGILREATSEEGEMCHARDFSQVAIIFFFLDAFVLSFIFAGADP